MKTTIAASTVKAPATTETYASAYARLTAIAEKLKGAGAAADLDGLGRVDIQRRARAMLAA
ncbi:hypothetical protein [Lichenibacterium dinghuense]|uniref:hypothetical protein n=1 Tax=Lichenibacterium dinghuense TaxID=2895977 RepID=UPI001F22F51C|nr:hypothetical protein [Lichenibacterium sp. 6Y81]